MMTILTTTSKSIDIFNEIALQKPEGVQELYEQLTSHERIVAYYLYRASLPANKITADQYHRHTLLIQDIFEGLYRHKELVEIEIGTEFVNQIKTYLVYLWTNHGPYFKREFANNKRTITKLGLSLLTPQSLKKAMYLLGMDDVDQILSKINDTLYSGSVEPTLTATGSIEKSAVNIYSPEFTKAYYDELPAHERGHINARYSVDTKTGKPLVTRYSINGCYSNELTVAIYWLQKAHDYALLQPDLFDSSFIKSLHHLIEFFKTGDEEQFKQHSREWLNIQSTLDYTFGFIETYDDPLETTGTMAAEITIKKHALKKLATLLPSLEAKLPFPKEFHREKMDTLPNASINTQLFGAGDLGPLSNTLAYCLPNYSEIRSQVGSKQVIYPAHKSLAESINKDYARKLFYLEEELAWFAKNDPSFTLLLDIENLLTILHETIGHASGRLATHTFKEDEPLTTQGTTYIVGTTINVTSEILSELLSGYEGALEELRAEIIALYVAITHTEELAAQGFLGTWYAVITKNELISLIILQMARSGLRRLISQNDDAKEIAGHHAQANTCIMNYLVDHGGLEIITQKLTVENKDHEVVGLRIVDLDKTIFLVTKLMQEVQHCKSTAEVTGTKRLIDGYGKRVRKDCLKIIKDNQKAVVGDLKARAWIYPTFIPVYQEGNIVDVTMSWPKSFFEANMEFSKIALETT